MNDVKSSLFSLFVGTITSFTVWLAIVITVDPNKSDIITKGAFFASLFLTLTGVLTFVLIYIRSTIPNTTISHILTTSIIHSSIAAMAATLLLILQALRVLGLWEGFIVVLLFVLIEFYLHASQRRLE